MKYVLFFIAFFLAACTAGETKFSAPEKNAPGWDLNVGRWPGTNDLIHPPQEVAR